MAGRKANSAYMLFGQIFGKAGLFVSLMIYSRILQDGPFGELLFAVSIGLVIIFLSDMGATMLITRRIAAGSPVNSILSPAIILRTALSAITLCAVMLAGWAAGYSSKQLVLILLVSTGFILDGFCETSFAVFRARGLMIYEAIDEASLVDKKTIQIIALTEAAFEKYRKRDFNASIKLYNRILELNPDDHISNMFLDRCNNFIKNEPAEDWDDCFIMQTK